MNESTIRADLENASEDNVVSVAQKYYNYIESQATALRQKTRPIVQSVQDTRKYLQDNYDVLEKTLNIGLSEALLINGQHPLSDIRFLVCTSIEDGAKKSDGLTTEIGKIPANYEIEMLQILQKALIGHSEPKSTNLSNMRRTVNGRLEILNSEISAY